jgi:LysR family transcriptional activator of glutamate synthase operon
MELRQLNYFLLVAEEKSFMKASKKAFISPQALSKAIQNLEEELQGSLFERKASGVEITPLGIILLRRAKQIVDLVNLTYSDLNISNAADKKMIRFGVPYSVLDLLNMDKVFEFQQESSNFSISIVEEPDKIVESEVYYNYLDIGIVGGKNHFTHFDYTLLLKSDTYIAMHKDNPFANAASVRLSDLRDETFVAATKDYNVYDGFLKACAESGFTPRISQQSGNIELIKQFVLMKQGIYPCPDNRMHLMTSSDIVLKPLEDPTEIFTIYLITAKDKPLSKLTTSFRDHLIKITTEDMTGWSKHGSLDL